MSELKPCPCGKTPKTLYISDAGQGGKWAYMAGDCCGDWEHEFRTAYLPLDSDELYGQAVIEWNLLARAEPAIVGIASEHEILEQLQAAAKQLYMKGWRAADVHKVVGVRLILDADEQLEAMNAQLERPLRYGAAYNRIIDVQ